MNINSLQKSKTFRFLSTYFAFVFIVLQVVDILSEPFSLPDNFIVYLVYIFIGVLILIIIFNVKGGKDSKPTTYTDKQSKNNYMVPVLSLIHI